MHKQISIIIAQDKSVFVPYLKRVLLMHGQTRFPQSVGLAVFIDFLEMTVPQETVQGEAGFPDPVAKGKDIVSCHKMCIRCPIGSEYR